MKAEIKKPLSLYIVEELGPNAYQIAVYRYGDFVGYFVGYIRRKDQTVKCYPYKQMEPGAFTGYKFPIVCDLHKLQWEKTLETG